MEKNEEISAIKEELSAVHKKLNLAEKLLYSILNKVLIIGVFVLVLAFRATNSLIASIGIIILILMFIVSIISLIIRMFALKKKEKSK